MKLGKKLAAAGLVGILAVGQSVSASASVLSTYTLTVGYGTPQILGDSIYHSISVNLDSSEKTYLAVDMKAYYALGAGLSYSGYELASNEDTTTKKTAIGAFHSWRDSGSAISRVYGKYDAYGYKTYSPSIA